MVDDAAQKLYEDFLAQEHKCMLCGETYKFSIVFKWGEHSGPVNIHCPKCETADRIDDGPAKEAMERISEVDDRISKKIVECADKGLLKAQYDYRIAMIIKYHFRFKQQIGLAIPLSYTDRTCIRAIYEELVNQGHVEPVDVYEVKAPVPVTWESKQSKTIVPTFKGLGGDSSKKTRRAKKKKGQNTLSFGFTKPKPKEEGD